jgi:hypothetical protein
LTEADAPFWTAQPNPLGDETTSSTATLLCVDLLTDDEHRAWEYDRNDLSTVGLQYGEDGLTISWALNSVSTTFDLGYDIGLQVVIDAADDSFHYDLRQTVNEDGYALFHGATKRANGDLVFRRDNAGGATIEVTYPAYEVGPLTAFTWRATVNGDGCPADGELVGSFD